MQVEINNQIRCVCNPSFLDMDLDHFFEIILWDKRLELQVLVKFVHDLSPDLVKAFGCELLVSMAYFDIFFVDKGFQMEPSVADQDQRQPLADATALNHAHKKVRG